MGNKTELYLNGMRSFNDFFECLYAAMSEAMPGAALSDNGAYVWRGYRIDSYKDLAYGQYYCQIYLPDGEHLSQKGLITKVQTLIFQEGYNEYHKPLYPRDKEYGINSGDYYYPFSLKLQLYPARFFLMSAEEQYTFLLNFIDYASRQALAWQRSAARTSVTSTDRLSGKMPLHSRHRSSHPFEHVTADFLDAFYLQHQLLKPGGDLVQAINKTGPDIVGRKVLWLRPNAHPKNWDFRGWRLKFDGLNPDPHADYRWEILYNSPEKLICFHYDGNKKTKLGHFDFQKNNYFDLSTDERKNLMESFIGRSLNSR